MATNNLKQLKIKAGVAKRLAKEKLMYQNEVVTHTAKLEEMRSQDKDEYEIKNMVRILEESQSVIPDVERRLATAVAELSDFINSLSNEEDSEDYKLAVEALEYAKPISDA